jgi:hypothetical protein
MKTLNEDIKRMMSLMDAQHGVIYPLINEQNGQYWDNVTVGTGGAKLITKDFSASNQFNFPNKGSLNLVSGSQLIPIYIGARLTGYYNKSAKFSEGPVAVGPSSRFGYRLDFFLSTIKGSTWNNATNPSPNRSFPILYIKCAQNINKKFNFITSIVQKFQPSDSLLAYKSKNTKSWLDTTVNTRNTLSNDKMLGDMGSWTGSLFTNINTELENMGFPVLPNSIQLSMTL